MVLQKYQHLHKKKERKKKKKGKAGEAVVPSSTHSRVRQHFTGRGCHGFSLPVCLSSVPFVLSHAATLAASPVRSLSLTLSLSLSRFCITGPSQDGLLILLQYVWSSFLLLVMRRGKDNLSQGNTDEVSSNTWRAQRQLFQGVRHQGAFASLIIMLLNSQSFPLMPRKFTDVLLYHLHWL